MYNNFETSISGIVLAGGRATRMGGHDKGLLTIAHHPMIWHIIHQLKPQCSTVLINANRNLEKYQHFADVFEDKLENYQGPLAGMLAALQHSNTEWIITTPCDGPFVTANYVDKMLTAAKQQNTLLAVATDAIRLQPVYCLIHQSLESDLAQFLLSGERKIDKWFNQHHYSQVDFSQQQDMFLNINTAEMLDEINTQFSQIYQSLHKP